MEKRSAYVGRLYTELFYAITPALPFCCSLHLGTFLMFLLLVQLNTIQRVAVGYGLSKPFRLQIPLGQQGQ